jgi:hypothetical protein
MEMLLHILISAQENLQGSEYAVEIWHDYFSVPQWNYTIKEKLLLHLPSIFSASTACLVHLDNFHSSLLGRLTTKPSDKDISEITSVFFNSRWFRRMWVTLEYIQCDVVHLLSSDFHVSNLDPRDHDPPFQQGSFSFLWDLFIAWKDQWQYSRLTGLFSRQQVREYVRNRTSKITFAQAFSIIASKECSIHRDLAICGFLRLGTHAQVSSEIPEDSVRACIWVALKCLEAGDYSPLLLIPFALSYKESEVPGFSWLVGHEKMIDIHGNQLG